MKPTGGGITFLQVSSEELAPNGRPNITQQPNYSSNVSSIVLLSKAPPLTITKLDTGEANSGAQVPTPAPLAAPIPTPAPIPPSLPSDAAQPPTRSLGAMP